MITLDTAIERFKYVYHEYKQYSVKYSFDDIHMRDGYITNFILQKHDIVIRTLCRKHDFLFSKVFYYTEEEIYVNNNNE